MNQPLIIASTILAIALLAAAWLLKPIPPPCWTTIKNPPPLVDSYFDSCTGEVWDWMNGSGGELGHYFRTFSTETRVEARAKEEKARAEIAADEAKEKK